MCIWAGKTLGANRPNSSIPPEITAEGSWKPQASRVGVFSLPSWIPLVLTFHKYDDVCCERDALGFKALRRADAGYRRGGATKKMGASRRNPLGGGRLRSISSSLVVDDVPASPPSRSLISPGKPPPQTSPYLWKGALSYRFTFLFNQHCNQERSLLTEVMLRNRPPFSHISSNTYAIRLCDHSPKINRTGVRIYEYPVLEMQIIVDTAGFPL